jgi:replicative superfamily II helicase
VITDYRAKYFAHDLTRRASGGMDRLSMSLFDAAVDLNPHQIEAALFALQSPLSKGVLLADEVGLGKTIEAGIVLCQFWAEHKRRLLVLCPASLRKQWALELQEKLNLPVQVVDAKVYRELRQSGRLPLAEKAVLIMSFNFTNSMRDDLKAIAWDLVVIDEAHKLRNAYRPRVAFMISKILIAIVEDRVRALDALLLQSSPGCAAKETALSAASSSSLGDREPRPAAAISARSNARSSKEIFSEGALCR